MKNIIESLLITHLGKYIQGLQNSIDIDLLDGIVTVENVSLRNSFVNELGLPFSLKFSHIQKIHIDIPWTNLKEKSTVVSVKGVYAILNMTYEDSDEQFDPHQRLKAMFERIKIEVKKKFEQANKQETFAEKNLIRIIDNMVLNINNIHLRIESFKRNWDFSIGVVMDDICSYTVDQYEQKYFYTRSFSKKQKNKPLKKILNINRFEIYFNEDEKLFMSNLIDRGVIYMIHLMNRPFHNREINLSKSFRKKLKHQKLTFEDIENYSIQTFLKSSLSAVGTQTFAEDLRYNVDLNVNINTIELQITNKQLSNLLFTVQHFYEFALNVVKNGRKQYNFGKEVEAFYRSTITKYSKEQKLTSDEKEKLIRIVRECPFGILEEINDEIINEVKFAKEMKKISKISNVEKSNKKIQQLLEKKQNLDAMEGFQFFKTVVIEAQIGKVTINLKNKGDQWSQWSAISLQLKTVIQLKGQITLGLFVSNLYFKNKLNKELSTDLFDSTRHVFHMNLTLYKGEIRQLGVNLLKKSFIIDEEMIADTLTWIEGLKIRPCLVNYFEEFMNYSIDITKIFLSFLFCQNRKIEIRLQVPSVLFLLKNKSQFCIETGILLGVSCQNNKKFKWTFAQPFHIDYDSLKLLTIEKDSQIIFNKSSKQNPFEAIQIQLKSVQLNHCETLIIFYDYIISSAFYKKYKSIPFTENQEQELDGQFYLNRISKHQIVLLKNNTIMFQPSQQSINLSRNRLYKLQKQEEVNKEINLVSVKSKKLMETVFFKFKEYLHLVCTSYQWEKYYKQPYEETILSLHQIQDISLDNQILMSLQVNVISLTVQFSPQVNLSLRNTKSLIRYRQFNTQASAQLNNLSITIDQERVIYDACFKAHYQHLQTMLLSLEICQLYYQIKNYSTFSTVVQLVSKYRLLFKKIKFDKKQKRNQIDIEENEEKMKTFRIDSGSNNLLLEKKFSIETEHIQGYLLGYQNNLQFISLLIEQYRNEKQLYITLQMKKTILLSMLEIPYLRITINPKLLDIKIQSINLQMHFGILLFEMVKGEGSVLLKQILKVMKQRKIFNNQHKDSISKVSTRETSLTIESMRIELVFTENFSLGLNASEIELETGRLAWGGANLWLNGECISIAQNHTIIKIVQNKIDICMTSVRIKLNSKYFLEAFYELRKIHRFLKQNKFDLEQIIEQELRQELRSKNIVSEKRQTNIRIEQIELVYECGDKNPLCCIKLKPVFLSNYCELNSISISVWHLNRNLKLYQPIMEPIELKLIYRQSISQLEILSSDLHLVLSQQLVIDSLQEVKVLQQISTQYEKNETNELQAYDQEQIQNKKKYLIAQQFEYYFPPQQEKIQYSSILKLVNHLSTKLLVEVTLGKNIKQTLIYEGNSFTGKGQVKTLKIPLKTSYNYSYELIERYQRVHLRISMIDPIYSGKCKSFSFLLYERDNFYAEDIVAVDQEGVDIPTALSLRVTYESGIYKAQIQGKYSLSNMTEIPFHTRFTDHTINKMSLNKNQTLYFPLWVTDYFKFGLKEEQYPHIFNLEGHNEEEEDGGHIELNLEDGNYRTKMIAIKERISLSQKYVRVVPQPRVVTQLEDQLQQEVKIEEVQNQVKVIKHQRVFRFKLTESILIINHLTFPLTINKTSYEFQKQCPLNGTYFQLEQPQKQYIKLQLGDSSIHEIYIPNPQTINQVKVKLIKQNYINLKLQTRKNSKYQLVIHIYCQLQLMVNLPHIHEPTMLTTIYNQKYILKKEVCNNYSDKIHPKPVLRDKFVFSTYHFLLDADEKYVSIKVKGQESNQIIVYTSDYNTDLIFKEKPQESEQSVFAVSYDSKIHELEQSDPQKKPQTLETFYTTILPKYYLINRSESQIIVNDIHFIRVGEKIVIPNNKKLEFSLKDQQDFDYQVEQIQEVNRLIFVRKVRGRSISIQANFSECEVKEIHYEGQQKIYYEESELDGQRKEDISTEKQNQKPTQEHPQKHTKEQIQQQTSQQQVKVVVQLQEEQGEGKLKNSSLLTTMDNIRIFSLNKRVGDYNTVSYEISDWVEWISFKNQLDFALIVRTQLPNSLIGEVRIQKKQTNKIIAGLTEFIEVYFEIDGDEILLGQFSLNQRLNDTITFDNCKYSEIVIKETKVKVGRFATICQPDKSNNKNIHKVKNSLIFKLNTIKLSLVANEDDSRKEIMRSTICHPRVICLAYKNGLYMNFFELQKGDIYFKRKTILTLKQFKAFVEGFEGEFVERFSLQTSQAINITITDQLLLTVLKLAEVFKQYLPQKSSLSDSKQMQDEQTYHLNSVFIKPLTIRITVQKLISQITNKKLQTLSKLGFTLVEIEDAVINLSEVQINEPIKQRHLNGISKMYTMESVLGIVSGLNILGNPSQFSDEFQAGRNKGGVIPFFSAIIAGTTNSVSKIIGTIGSGLSELTFDHDFQREIFQKKGIRAESFTQGLAIGAKEFASSLKSSITGLVEQPIQRQKQEGGLGILKGTLIGLTGLVTKPLTGIVLATSKTIQGINSSTSYIYDSHFQAEQLITRPLYHKFKLIRPFKHQQELAYNIMLNWYNYKDLELVGSYLLQNEEGDNIIELLIITCQELIIIDLNQKQISMQLKLEELLATGKFNEGVVLYFQNDEGEDQQDEVIFRMRKDVYNRDNLYYTLKGFIGIYAQES